MSPSVVVASAVAVAVLAVASATTTGGPAVAEVRTRRRAAVGRAASPSRIGADAGSGHPASRARDLLDRLLDVVGGAERARRRADRQLPQLLDHVTRHLLSGASLPVAVQAAAADSTDASTARLADELGAGAGLAPSVDEWHRACPTPARGLAAAALALASEAGGSVALVLDGVTDTLRDRVALEREVAALSSQARASAVVLVVAPMVFAGLAAVADPRVARVLLGRPVGWACIAVGLALDAVGAAWMSRLASRAR